MRERYNRVIFVAVPESDREEIVEGLSKKDPVTAHILERDIKMVEEGLKETGVLDVYDSPLVKFEGSEQVETDAPRPARMYSVTDEMGKTVKIKEDLGLILMNVKISPEDCVN